MPDNILEEPYFVYQLGSKIVPMNEVRTGNIYPSGRIWSHLDLLLTCEMISEARDKTQERISNY